MKNQRVRIYAKELKAEIAELRERLSHINDKDYSDILDLQRRLQIIESEAFNMNLNTRVGEIIDRELDERLRPWWKVWK